MKRLIELSPIAVLFLSASGGDNNSHTSNGHGSPGTTVT